MKVVAALLTAGLLVGCASTPKPWMTDHEYTWFAGRKGWINNCLSSNKLSVEHAAIGHQHTNAHIEEFQYSPSYLEMWTQKYSVIEVTTEGCNALAVQYEQIKQNRAASARLPSFQTPVPTNTTCNTMYGITRCTTY